MLDGLDLKKLRYFTVIAELGSFTRAAERIGIAQPHLSRHIMGLEATVGHKLFIRRARRVELTDAGAVLLDQVHSVLSALSALPERLSEAANGGLGAAVIGVTPEASLHQSLGLIITRLSDLAPQIGLRFCVDARASLIDGLLERRVQACFTRQPLMAPAGVRVDLLAREAMYVAMPPSHALANRREVTPAELAADAFILCERASAPEGYDRFLMTCHEAGFSPHVALHVPQPACALSLVAGGLGVSLAPASMRGMHGDAVRYVPIAAAALERVLALLTNADEQASSVLAVRSAVLAAVELKEAVLAA